MAAAAVTTRHWAVSGKQRDVAFGRRLDFPILSHSDDDLAGAAGKRVASTHFVEVADVLDDLIGNCQSVRRMLIRVLCVRVNIHRVAHVTDQIDSGAYPDCVPVCRAVGSADEVDNRGGEDHVGEKTGCAAESVQFAVGLDKNGDCGCGF